MDQLGAIKNAVSSLLSPQPQKLISPIDLKNSLVPPAAQNGLISPIAGALQTLTGTTKGAAPVQAQTQQQVPQYTYSYPPNATDYEKQAGQIFQKYGVPPAIGMGIYAMEGRGKTINLNNPYNIGAYDSNPQNANAYHFGSPLEGTEEAAKFLAGQSDYQTQKVKSLFQKALQTYQQSNDQNQYLKDIAPTYSSNKNYVKTVMQTPEYQRWSYNTN